MLPFAFICSICWRFYYGSITNYYYSRIKIIINFNLYIADSSKTSNSPLPCAKTTSSILKSKSGCIGLFPTDLSSELKSRLKKSTHASLSNLKKTSKDAPEKPLTPPTKKTLETNVIEKKKKLIPAVDDERSDTDSEDGIDPSKNLAKILRGVSKASSNQHDKDDNTGDLLKNLANVGKMAQFSRLSKRTESSSSKSVCDGNQKIKAAAKDTSVIRRRKFNEK